MIVTRATRNLSSMTSLQIAFALAVCAIFLSLPAYAFEHVDGFEAGIIDESWWLIDKDEDCRIDVAEGKARYGSLAVRFQAKRDSRCELVHWPSSRWFQWLRREPYKTSRWYGFSVYLPEDRPPGDRGRNEVIAQWHASDDPWFFEPGGRGPPLALRIQENRWRITYGWDADLRSRPGVKAYHLFWEGAAQLGEWTDWVFHVVWDPHGNGLLRIWKNGNLLGEHQGPIGYNDLRGVYLKLGSYHPRADQVVYLDEVRVGGERAIVEPLLDRDSESR